MKLTRSNQINQINKTNQINQIDHRTASLPRSLPAGGSTFLRSFSLPDGELFEQFPLPRVRSVGVRTSVTTNKSPFPLPSKRGIPFPLSRNAVPLCVPAGTVTRKVSPPSPVTEISVPSAASGNVTLFTI